MEEQICFIMLAAGNSHRFGSNKLLHEIDGRPMYEHTLEKMLQAAPKEACVTVVTQYKVIAEKAEKKGARVCWNFHPEEGISSSLKLGLQENLDADACLFAVSDQPWLSYKTIEKLVMLWKESEKGMACVSCNGKLGNPCIFSKKYYEELLTLTGDKGGKVILRKYPEDTAVLVVEDGQELVDLDIPTDQPGK